MEQTEDNERVWHNKFSLLLMQVHLFQNVTGTLTIKPDLCLNVFMKYYFESLKEVPCVVFANIV